SLGRVKGLLLLALALGCSGAATTADPATSCQMALTAHLAPLLPAEGVDIQYTEVAARQGVAYLGTWQGEGVLVRDVATGAELGRLDAGMGHINSIALAGHLLAVAPVKGGLVVYDVSDPRQPARRAAIQAPARTCHTG